MFYNSFILFNIINYTLIYNKVNKNVASYLIASLFTYYIVIIGLYGQYYNTLNQLIPNIAVITISYYTFDSINILINTPCFKHFILHHIGASYIANCVLQNKVTYEIVSTYFIYIELSNLFININKCVSKKNKDITLVCLTLTYIPLRTVVLWYNSYYMILDNYNKTNDYILYILYIGLIILSASYSVLLAKIMNKKLQIRNVTAVNS